MPAIGEPITEFKLHEREAWTSAKGRKNPAGLQVSIPIPGVPPPHDRLYFQLPGRDALADVERALAWDGPEPEREALKRLGQGMSILFQERFSDEQVAQIVAAWVAWAKKGAK